MTIGTGNVSIKTTTIDPDTLETVIIVDGVETERIAPTDEFIVSVKRAAASDEVLLLGRYVAEQQAAAETLTDEQVQAVAHLFADWRGDGEAVALNAVRLYGGVAYR